MIRQWVEKRFAWVGNLLGRGVEKGGFSRTVRNGWVEFLYIGGIVVISAGIVNAIITPVGNNYIIYPGTDGQTIAETVINSMALVMGFGGFYLTFLSGRQTVKPRLVGFYLAIGLVLIMTALYIELYVYTSK